VVRPTAGRREPRGHPLDEDRLYTYLHTGLDENHAAAAGPMGPVVRRLANASDADVRAMAVYIAARMAKAQPPSAARRPPVGGRQAASGRRHGLRRRLRRLPRAGGGMMQQGRPVLPLGTPLHEDNPTDAIQIVLQGLHPPVGRAGPTMPPFADSSTDSQLAELTAYLRSRYSDRPAWRDLPAAVAKARKEHAA